MDKIEKYLTRLEKVLEPHFRSLPALSSPFVNFFVKFMPLITVLMGLITILDINNLWNNGHTVNSLISYANNNSNTYNIPKVPVSNDLNLAFWLGLILLVIEACLLIAAYKDTRKTLKSGWNLIFYAFVVNVAYGVIMLFSSYGGIGTLIGRLIFSGVCFYVLFEIKEYYDTSKHKKKAKAKKVTPVH